MNLKIKIHKPESTGNGIKRTPSYIPDISIDNHTLFIYDYIPEYTLQLKVEDRVFYEIIIPAGTQEIQLPEELVGDYELLLIFGGCGFCGEITL